MSHFAGAEGLQVNEGLVLREVRPDCRLAVVSVDFGTAYSGIAFALRASPGQIRYGAPTARDVTQAKVPTLLLELPGDRWFFGNDAETRYNELLLATPEGAEPEGNLYRGFKMVLRGENAGFETLTASSMSGTKRSLMELVTKSLQFLKDFAIAHVQTALGGECHVHTDIQWVLTVPAIWNDFGKAFMRKAAFKAGMTSEEQSDSLMLVLEPEGAALAVHVGAVMHAGILAEGSRFMVLDCGGGTIDITVHEVESIQPLSMKAIAAPSGSDLGGQRVNAEFRKFVEELLGPELFDEHGQLLGFVTIYNEFEKIKMMHNPSALPKPIQMIDVLDNGPQLRELAAAWNAKHPEKTIIDSPTLARGLLQMSKELMLSFFEPSVLSAIEETNKVVTTVRGIQNIMVVGGFGSSMVLGEHLRDAFKGKRGLRVIVPENPKPQGAIAHGAVYFGLHSDIVASRVTAYTYGVAVRQAGVDEVFSILVRKGDTLRTDHEEMLFGFPISDTQTTITWRLYRSDKDLPKTVEGETHLGDLVVPCPMNPVRAERKQTAYFAFGRSEISIAIEDMAGNVTKGVITM